MLRMRTVRGAMAIGFAAALFAALTAPALVQDAKAKPQTLFAQFIRLCS